MCSDENQQMQDIDSVLLQMVDSSNTVISNGKTYLNDQDRLTDSRSH